MRVRRSSAWRLHLVSIFLAVTSVACGPTTPDVSEPATASPSAPQPLSTGVPPPDPGVSGSEAVVIARIVDSGPIGDGRCSQRSYQIVVERLVTGNLPTGGDPIAAHFESCADHPAPQPGPGDFVGSSLDVGSTYELSMRRGASVNFGDDFMILQARPAPR